MKTLALALLIPIAVPFLGIRFVVRGIAMIIFPIEIVFTLFGFGIAWLIFHAWSIVYAPSRSTHVDDNDDETTVEWRAWGRCMTEGGFDTLTAILMVLLTAKFGVGLDLATPIAQFFGNEDYMIWFPFWLVSLLPFLIRLNLPPLPKQIV